MKKAIALLTVLLLALSLFACGDNETDIYTAPEDSAEDAAADNSGDKDDDKSDEKNWTKSY